MLRSFFAAIDPPRSRAAGQGIVEYALVLAFVSTILVGVLSLIGGRLGESYLRVACAFSHQPVQYSSDGLHWFGRDDSGRAAIVSCVDEDGGPYRLAWNRSAERNERLDLGVQYPGATLP